MCVFGLIALIMVTVGNYMWETFCVCAYSLSHTSLSLCSDLTYISIDK